MHSSREANEAKWSCTFIRASAFEEKQKSKTKQDKIPPHQNTPRNPQQTGDNDHLATARRSKSHAFGHTRPLLRSRVCRNRPRTALAIGENDKCYIYTDIPIK